MKTILLIEDDEVISKVYAADLTDGGFVVLIAKNGKEGVELALSAHPDLILLDLLMPQMDGMTTLKKIREDSWGKKVPVIILTNLNPTDENIIKDIVAYRPFYYLVKSDWKVEDVIKKIKGVLDIVG